MMTDPFVGLVPRKLTEEELTRAIRLDIAAELDAINLYQAHVDATENEQARKILAFVRDDEKEHVALFLKLLRTLDPTQAMELESKRSEVESGPSGAPDADTSMSVSGQPGQEPGAAGQRLTVGSLNDQAVRLGRMAGTKAGAGPGGTCVCPSCGATLTHQTGRPCYEIWCPVCGTPMVRG